MTDERTTLRLSADLKAQLQKEADKQRRSLHAQMLVYLERGVQQDQASRKRTALRRGE